MSEINYSEGEHIGKDDLVSVSCWTVTIIGGIWIDGGWSAVMTLEEYNNMEKLAGFYTYEKYHKVNL